MRWARRSEWVHRVVMGDAMLAAPGGERPRGARADVGASHAAGGRERAAVLERPLAAVGEVRAHVVEQEIGEGVDSLARELG